MEWKYTSIQSLYYKSTGKGGVVNASRTTGGRVVRQSKRVEAAPVAPSHVLGGGGIRYLSLD